nr:hypothetical protein Itr_chr09CG16260 [Ipomoea trifida]GLL35883.1 hypothetical protein Itr_chr09CG16270 [Ipomoea trifida]
MDRLSLPKQRGCKSPNPPSPLLSTPETETAALLAGKKVHRRYHPSHHAKTCRCYAGDGGCQAASRPRVTAIPATLQPVEKGAAGRRSLLSSFSRGWPNEMRR